MSGGYVNFKRYNDYHNEMASYTSLDPDPEGDDGSRLLGTSGTDTCLASPIITTGSTAPTKRVRLNYTTLLLVILCVFLTISLLVVCVVWSTENKSTHKNKRNNKELRHFIQISDIHLDIYFNSNVTSKNNQGCRDIKHKHSNKSIDHSGTTAMFGRFNCDSPSSLLKSLQVYLGKMSSELESDVEFILLTGDQVAHGYNYFDVDLLESVLSSIGNSTKYISQGLPGIPILMGIGNNDLKSDYVPPVGNHSEFYKLLYGMFEPYVFTEASKLHLRNSKEEFKKTFLLGGYYKIVLNGGKMMVIMLNTNYWSAKSYILKKAVTVIGDIQIKWLHEQLTSASVKGQRVIVAGHIPPGVSSYSGKDMWLNNYTNIYNMMMTMEKLRHVVTAQLYGHIHSDKIKVQYLDDRHDEVKNPDDKSFLLTCPSVTPVYAGNPSFRVYDYNEKAAKLIDYTQYYLDLAVSNVKKKAYWFKEYTFTDTYNTELTTTGIETIINRLLKPSSSTWFHYMQHIKAKMGSILYNERYKEYCAARHVYHAAYLKCIKAFKDTGA